MNVNPSDSHRDDFLKTPKAVEPLCDNCLLVMGASISELQEVTEKQLAMLVNTLGPHEAYRIMGIVNNDINDLGAEQSKKHGGVGLKVHTHIMMMRFGLLEVMKRLIAEHHKQEAIVANRKENASSN